MKNSINYSDTVTSPLPGDRFMLRYCMRYKDIIVPKGYKTNGANIPRIFWWLIPPNKSDILPAVIVHDYLCDKEEYQKADTYFEEILTELNVANWLSTVLVVSVKLYHMYKYGTTYKGSYNGN